MGLHVGVLRPEERRQAVAGQVLDLVDDLIAPVVAAARVALGVLVGEDRAGGRQHRRGGEVLRGDQLQRRGLALGLVAQQAPDLRVVDQPGIEGRGGEGAAHGVGNCLSWSSIAAPGEGSAWRVDSYSEISSSRCWCCLLYTSDAAD